MITTNDAAVAERCRTLRQHGMQTRGSHGSMGYNYRMSDIHAAIGLEQLKKMEHFNTARRRNAQYFNRELSSVITPFTPEGYHHVYHQYTIRIPAIHREPLREHLLENSIGCGVYYSKPIYNQPYYKETVGYDLSLSEAEKAAAEVLSIPVHPGLEMHHLVSISRTINQFMTDNLHRRAN